METKQIRVIQSDMPLEVTEKEYSMLVARLSGLIFHRIDENGKYWVKPAGTKACTYMEMLLDGGNQ